MVRPSPVFLTLFFAALLSFEVSVSQADTSLSHFKQDQIFGKFQVKNLYLDANDHEIGMRLLHIRTQMPVYLLLIDTVPQAFMWFWTDPDSDRGLPHSLEHLLAGKGTTGRYLGLLTEMRLGEESA